MNKLHDKAFKLAASFYLSSMHDDWSGERIRKAILADIDGDDEQAITDQKELKLWSPIEWHIEDNCSAMDDPAEILNDIIQNLADSFVQFAKENN